MDIERFRDNVIDSATERQRESYRKAGEKPAEAAEYECLDEPNDVQELPSFDGDAVAGKEDGDGTVDGHAQGEHKEPASAHYLHIILKNYFVKTSCMLMYIWSI